ncbi:hypothetical protein ACWGOQ_0020770 [Aquimarina sp. M1]
MKNLIIIAFLSFVTMDAQESQTLSSQTVTVGDVITLGKPSGPTYQHVLFPRINFIIKKGGTTNFKLLEGKKVVVRDKKVVDGITKVTIERKDGKKFLNSIASVTINFDDAVTAKEIL